MAACGCEGGSPTTWLHPATGEEACCLAAAAVACFGGARAPREVRVPLTVYLLRGGVPPDRGYHRVAATEAQSPYLLGEEGTTVAALAALLSAPDEGEGDTVVAEANPKVDPTGALADRVGRTVEFVALAGAARPRDERETKWDSEANRGRVVPLAGAVLRAAAPLHVVALVGFAAGAVDVGEFVDAAAAPVPGCGEWADLARVPADLVRRTVARVRGGGSALTLPLPRFSRSARPVVSAATAARVVARTQRAWRAAARGAPAPAPQDEVSPAGSDPAVAACAARIRAASSADDFKVVLAGDALEGLVGARARAAVVAALGAPPDLVVLRRTAARGGGAPRGVAFHTDVGAARTAHLWLGRAPGARARRGCEGGALVYLDAAKGRVDAPPPSLGALSCHDAGVVHGVTPLARGVRHVLLALRVRG